MRQIKLCGRLLACVAITVLGVSGVFGQVAPCNGGGNVQVSTAPSSGQEISSATTLSASNSFYLNTDQYGNVNSGSATYVTFVAGSTICLGPGFIAAGTSAGGGFAAGIAAPLSISGNLPSTAVVGQSYSGSLGATGGTSLFTWSIVGSLPPGLHITPATGAVTGTPTTAGSYTFIVKVTDSGNPSQYALASSTINVVYGLTITTSGTLPGGSVNTFYSQGLSGAGGTVPYTWSLIGGAFPAGVNLIGSPVWEVFGTPTAAGTAYFNLQVTDSGGRTAWQSFSLTIAKATPTITLSYSPTSPPLAFGQQVTLTASLSVPGATGTVTFYDSGTNIGTANVTNGAAAFSSTALPVGSNSISASYSGDSNNNASSSQNPLVFTVAPSAQYTDLSHPGTYYQAGDSASVTVNGLPNQPVYYTQFNGTFPFGTTNASGMYRGAFTWNNSDVGNYSQVWTVGTSPAVTALPNPLNLTVYASNQATAQLVDTTTGTNYLAGQTEYNNTDSFAITLHGGVNEPVTYVMTINGSQSSGSYTCNGNAQQTAYTDSNGMCLITGQWAGGASASIAQTWYVGGIAASPNLDFTLISNGSSPSITPATLPAGTTGLSYTTTLSATGGAGSYNYWTVVSGALPGGLTLGSSTGTVSGTPNTAGVFSFSVTVQDSMSRVSPSQPFSITISAPNEPYITTTSLPNGTLGTAYPNQQLTAAGGTGYYPTWQYSGTLPGGLTLNTSGLIGGTPTAAGTFDFSVTVTDSAGHTSQPEALSITISAALVTEYIRLGGRVVAIEHGVQ